MKCFRSCNCLAGILGTMLILHVCAAAEQLSAYYTKIDSGAQFEQYSRTGPYADIVVELAAGRLCFWRGSSYLPYWETDQGKWFVEELVPRGGDGPPDRPDRVNNFSRVALIESTPEQAVVCWRYLPEFAGQNPRTGVAATKFVEEYFTITAHADVTRAVSRGTPKIDDWRKPGSQIVQTFKLTARGIADVTTVTASASATTAPVQSSPTKRAVPGAPVVWWKFDEAEGDIAVECVSNTPCEIVGHKSLWKPGVSGTALQFDGYNTEIRLPASSAPKPTSGLTVEAWVAIGAYPWSWTPIVQQTDDPPEVLSAMRGDQAFLIGEEDREQYEEDRKGEEDNDEEFTFVLKAEDDTGYFLGIDGYGRPGLKLRAHDAWHELVAETVLQRRRWYHVAGTYDGDSGDMVLYVDGKPVAQQRISGGNIMLSHKDVVIGKGKPRRPIRPVRPNTFIDAYALDGLLDEVRIHDTALSATDVARIHTRLKPADRVRTHPPMDQRVLPAGTNTGEFGAYYAHLKFYETWDNLWRFGEHPDIVVEFDELPAKFVFWRGVGYIPMLVNEQGQWYSNEFNETWNKSGGQGCQEPMSDKESYTNHVRIIENTPARVVVHWRYPLVDVLHVIANYDENTGWGDWSDWYYYIYPDGVAVKTMHLWTDGERNHEWHEGMAILGPDQHPEQVLETQPALILADLDGNVAQHEWVHGPPDDVDYDNMKIHVVNYKAAYDPFTIGDFEGGNVYGGEVTEYAVFPSWNHWPVAQMPSDGRFATYPDRTAHSSLTHVELPTYREEFGDRPFEQRILMEGMSNKSAAELVPLAKSWLHAARLDMSSGGTSEGYDPAQRAYVLNATDTPMTFVLQASEDQPVVNPCFVVKNWGDAGASVEINGQAVARGKGLRIGHPHTIRTYDLVVWVKLESTSPVNVSIVKTVEP